MTSKDDIWLLAASENAELYYIQIERSPAMMNHLDLFALEPGGHRRVISNSTTTGMFTFGLSLRFGAAHKNRGQIYSQGSLISI